ncbi:MAG: hypothetical protein KGQ59_07155 [Bdellovibrionales bacterium]|nr:hypothetical protein [Bdellovibrionales bacterium]
MKVWKTIVLALIALHGFCSWQAQASGIRSRLPWSAGFEVLGRAVLYGFSLERSLSDRFALGLAFAQAEAQASTSEAKPPSTGLIPVSAFWYLSESQTSFFLIGGWTWIPGSSGVGGRRAILGTLRYPTDPFMAHGGLGWEIRQENGFLFRVFGLVTRSASTSLSMGLNLGFAF